MLNIHYLIDFIEPVDALAISGDEGYVPGQLGHEIMATHPDDAHLILVGCAEWRGANKKVTENAADAVRKAFYNLYYWHSDIRISDIGNIKPGASLADSYAALNAVCRELMDAGKKVLVIGGSHDNMLGQYQAFVERKQIIEVTVVDALLDLKQDTPVRSENFLLDMLTSEPNFIRHYNHIAFQSYFVHPKLLETIDKLRFDCFRVGKIKEQIDEMEPVIRNTNLISFDMNALAYGYAPANSLSTNGLDGQEACKLMQYAGMSVTVETVGLYGFDAAKDKDGLTAMQMAHMIWYYMDGLQKQGHEANLEDRENFNEFHTMCADIDTVFLQSKRSGRWWMQLPDKTFAACSYADYITASHNDLPERWLRAQERM